MSEARTIDPDDAARLCAEAVAGSGEPGERVGLEVEFFPMRLDAGSGGGRPNLARVLAALDGLGTPTTVAGNPARDLGALGTVTFEPGAQIEHVGPPLPPAAALEVAEAVETEIADRLAAHDLVALSLGWDPWHDAAALGQQLPGARYRAMDRYFDARGGLGPEMMRNTCALQVNVDATPARWEAACLLAPLLSATFASAPDPVLGSRRATIWQQLDPTRTGVPSPSADPAAALCELALDADVLLLWRDGTAHPGLPGWSFADWMADGHPEFGPPTESDFTYHLTTLFPEVRPRRGVLEIRGIDALPTRWRTAAVTLVVGALYDAGARDGILDAMSPHREQLDELWRRAARRGLADDLIATLADDVWSLARGGAARMEGFDHAHLEAADDYLDRHVERRQAPGRVLADLDRPEVVAWASTTRKVTA